MSKTDICAKVTSNPLMVRKLLVIIRHDRMGSDRQRLHELDDSIRHGLSSLALDLSQQSQARFALCKRDNGMAMSFSKNRIHFPITQALDCIHDSRSLVDAHPIFELPTPIIAPIALPALFPWSGSSTGIVGDDGDLLPHVYP